MNDKIKINLGKALVGSTEIELTTLKPHMLIVGRTGSGKTNLVSSILRDLSSRYLDEHLSIRYASAKYDAATAGYDFGHENFEGVCTYASVGEALTQFVSLAHVRSEGGRSNGNRIFETRAVLILDELENGDLKDLEKFTKVLSICGELGMHVIFTSQDHSIFNSSLGPFIHNRVCLRCWDKTSDWVLGRDFAARITQLYGYAWSTNEIFTRDSSMTFWQLPTA